MTYVYKGAGHRLGIHKELFEGKTRVSGLPLTSKMPPTMRKNLRPAAGRSASRKFSV